MNEFEKHVINQIFGSGTADNLPGKIEERALQLFTGDPNLTEDALKADVNATIATCYDAVKNPITELLAPLLVPKIDNIADRLVSDVYAKITAPPVADALNPSFGPTT